MKSFSRTRTAGALADTLILVLDALALFALFSTNEIPPWVFAIAGAVGLVRVLGKVRLDDHVLVALLFSVILGAIAVGIRGKIHPIWAAAYATPIFHAFLWLAQNERRFRSWRVGIGFIGLVLASALTPEFHIFALIIVFIVLCSLAVSSVFLDNTLQDKAPTLASRPLPPGFLRYSVSLSAVIFLSSLLIFPILPRARLSSDLGFGRSEIGYKEEVNVSEWTRFRGAGQDRIVLRIFLPEFLREMKGLPFGLLRGKVLEHFNGSDWVPATKSILESSGVDSHSADSQQSFEVISEPFASTVAILPYHVTEVWPDSAFRTMRHFASNEWQASTVPGRRLHYHFFWNPRTPNSLAQDKVREIHLRTLPYPAKAKVEALAKRLERHLSHDSDKIRAVEEYFKREHFTAVLAEEAGQGNDPLEDFLFRSKKGHCELFASSTALLLRHMGVATRLVVGFRLSREPASGVISVGTNDAHAWVEAYTKEHGWVPIDTTPGLVVPHSLVLDWLRNSYDALSAYWYRYVLSFDAEAQLDLRKNLLPGSATPNKRLPELNLGNFHWLKNTTVLLLFGIAAGLVLWVLSKLRLRLWYGSAKTAKSRELLLERERKRLEGLEREAQELAALRLLRQDWLTAYERHRYGRDFVAESALLELREKRLRYQAEAKRLRAS